MDGPGCHFQGKYELQKGEPHFQRRKEGLVSDRHAENMAEKKLLLDELGDIHYSMEERQGVSTLGHGKIFPLIVSNNKNIKQDKNMREMVSEGQWEIQKYNI